MNISPSTTSIPDTAFYYPGPVAYKHGFTKSALIFFDKVAYLIPTRSQADELIDRSHEYQELISKNLLYILSPEKIMDKRSTEQLVSAMTNIISSGVLDSLKDGPNYEFEYLSNSRMGYWGDQGLARMLHEELINRGLALESKDGYSTAMHPYIRGIILVLLAQILRPYGQEIGVNLLPTTDRPIFVQSLRQFLSTSTLPNKGTVISSDMEVVGVNLNNVPLNEVLDFRRQHQKEFKAYSFALRKFVQEMSFLNEEERQLYLGQRIEEIEDLASEAKRVSRQAWKKPLSIILAIAGAAWTLAAGDYVGAAIAGVSAALASSEPQITTIDAYSYLLKAIDEFG